MKCPIAPFKPEEFFAGKMVNCQDAAHIANAILEARWLDACKQAPEVFGFTDNSKDMYYGSWGTLHHPKDTHRAFLFGIEELKP